MFFSKKDNDNSSTYIIVGLGNPGKKYEATRHNIGFMVIDKIANKFMVDVNKVKYKALIGEFKLGRKKIILVKPQTFMNLSGQTIVEMLNFYKIPIENLIVIYDDIDINPKEIRIRTKGSAGTHNGMRSIVNLTGEKDFPRIRMGIGKSDVIPMIDFVIGKFTKDELKDMDSFLERSCDAVEMIVTDGIDRAMNKFNGMK